MPNSKQIVYLSQSQYAELIANGTITVNGVTVTYDENDIYVTPQAEPVTDVRVNGASVTANGVANIPVANGSTLGVMKVSDYNGVTIRASDNQLLISRATAGDIKNSNQAYKPITPTTQNEAVFYGLAKAAGADEKDSTLPVGQYTDTAKTAIRSMIGATSPNVIAVQDEAPTDTDTKIWLPETAETPVEVPTVAEMESALAGKVGDVRVNGASVVSEGIATIPVLGTYSQTGLVQVGTDSGLMPSSLANGSIMINPATDAYIKAGNKQYFAITTTRQHAAAFYGLAKAAGDTTQRQSDNAVGTYTDNAKASIKAMLGIQDGSTGTVDVTGATPTITAVENTRYVCGEVTSLNFTPAASGICIVRFTSGSTVTVLTLPSTVKFPEWFDPTSLETNTIYEICVTDGVYGAVMSWAL